MNKKLNYMISVLMVITSLFLDSRGFPMSIVIMPIVGILFYSIYREKAYKNSYKLMITIFTIAILYLLLEQNFSISIRKVYGSALYTVILFILAVIGMLLSNVVSLFKEKGKSLKKIILLVSITIVLLSPIVFFTNAFLGNPLSKMLAIINSDKYIEENYADLDIARDKTYYNFKNSEYVTTYQSDKLLDLNFNVRCNALGKVKNDNYKENIIEKGSTFSRLERELREEAKIEDFQDHSIQYSFFFDTEDKYNRINKLEAEMSLAEAKALFDVEIYLTYITKTVDINELQSHLIMIYEKHNKEYHIKTMYLDIEEGDDTIIFMGEIDPNDLYGTTGFTLLKEQYQNSDRKRSK